MSKIATYPSAETPLQLSDRLIGTEAIRPIPSATPLATKNFSLGELLQLFSSEFPVATLQAVLNAGNTATQNITLIGTITSTVIKPTNIEDILGSQGTEFQVLSKAVTGINWTNLPSYNLQSILNVGNTATQNINLIGNITSTKIIPGDIQDGLSSIGSLGQVLSKSASGIKWVTPIVYNPQGLADVLSVGNTATNDINLTGNISATKIIPVNIQDIYSSTGVIGQVLTKTTSGITWANSTSPFSSLTVIGNSGPSTLISGVLNIPTYTLSGLGGVPTSRTLSINGTSYDLSEDRSWTIPTSTSPLTTKGDLYTFGTANTRLPIGLNNQVLIADDSTPLGLKWTAQNTPTPLGYYGAFEDTLTQTLASANVGQPFLIRTTDESNQVSITANGSGQLTRITPANTGVYNIQWSGQFQNPDNAIHDVNVWFRKGLVSSSGPGTDVVGSNGLVAIPARKSAAVGEQGHVVIGWNFLLTIAAGEYVEFYWMSDSTLVTLQSYAAGSPPPSTASLIVTVTQQSGIMAGTGITAINSLTGASQTLTTGTSGTDFNIVDSGIDHKFNLPTASAINTGKLSNSDWNTFNNKQNSLSGTGFIKISGTTISYDNSTYYLASNPNGYITSSALTPYLPLTGGALSGQLTFATPQTIASASTVDLGSATSNIVYISGTTTINSFGTSTNTNLIYVKFLGALTLTYNATSMLLPGAVSKITVANDEAIFINLGGGNWKCISYTPYGVTGTGNTVLANSPTFNGNIGGSLTFTGNSTSFTGSGTFLIASANTITIGNGNGNTNYNLGNGLTSSGNTKAINIGTGGLAGSTTTINIGSAASTTTVTVNGNLKANNIVNSIIKDCTQSSAITGTIAETLIATYLIPANTFASNDIMKITSFLVEKTGILGNCTMRVKVGSTNVFSSATTIATYQFTLTFLNAMLQRMGITLRGGNLRTISGVSVLTDVNVNTSAYSNTAFNPAVDNYIFTSLQLGSASDSAFQSNFIMTN